MKDFKFLEELEKLEKEKIKQIEMDLFDIPISQLILENKDLTQSEFLNFQLAWKKSLDGED